MEETTLSVIPKEDFYRMLHYNQNFAARFIKLLANDIHEKEEKLLSLAYNSIRKRVAEALVNLVKDKPKNDTGNAITILRGDLANIVGTAKESVIRTLTDFKNEGLINVNHSEIEVLKLEKLQDLPG